MLADLWNLDTWVFYCLAYALIHSKTDASLRHNVTTVIAEEGFRRDDLWLYPPKIAAEIHDIAARAGIGVDVTLSTFSGLDHTEFGKYKFNVVVDSAGSGLTNGLDEFTSTTNLKEERSALRKLKHDGLRPEDVSKDFCRALGLGQPAWFTVQG